MRKRALLRILVLAVVIAALLIPAMPAAAQGGSTHVVRVGETLSSIAQRYGVSQDALARANGISNPDFIWVGQQLTIPGAWGGGQSYSNAGSGYSGSGGSVHIVQRGESLGSIAARYGTSAGALARANGISNPNLIYVGQRLSIPAGGASYASTGYSAAGGGTVAAAPARGGSRWIDIDLSAQTLTAYEGNSPVFQRLVSTGLNPTPTPVGTHSISWKLPSQRMTGPGYDLPNVPWVMYFTGRGHAIHGAYWHNNFGQPMSHGCVNMRPGDAQWLYNFAPVGTPVVVHW